MHYKYSMNVDILHKQRKSPRKRRSISVSTDLYEQIIKYRESLELRPSISEIINKAVLTYLDRIEGESSL